jgi:hypothetical protein
MEEERKAGVHHAERPGDTGSNQALIIRSRTASEEVAEESRAEI